jgi:hypothetical protein
MAESIRPRVGGKAGGSAVYQIARPRLVNNNGSSSVLNLNYPLFFIGTVVIAVVIIVIRKRDLAIGSSAPALVLNTTPASDAANVQNLANQVVQMNAGSYTPYGSANSNVI